MKRELTVFFGISLLTAMPACENANQKLAGSIANGSARSSEPSRTKSAPAEVSEGLGPDRHRHHGDVLAPGNLGVTVADYVLSTWPDLDDTSCGVRCFSLDYSKVPAAPNPKFWEYTNGVPVFGIQKLYRLTGQNRYLDYVKRFVDAYVDADGNISYARPYPAGSKPNDPTIQDTIQPAMLLFGLYQTTGDSKYLRAMANVRKVFPSIAVNSAGAFWHKPSYPNQQWLDAIYMSQPFLVKYGALYADQAIPGDSQDCFDTATFQIKLLSAITFNPAKKLYYHAWNGAADHVWLGLDPAKGKVPPLDGTRVSPVLWGRSIAWYLAGIVDVLDDLPRSHPDRPVLIQIVRTIAQGLRNYQDPATGLWYQVMDVMDGPLPANGGYPGESIPAASNWLETSSSAIFVYSLAKSIRLGYLPKWYLEVVKKGWAGVKSKVDVSGDGTVVVHDTVVGMSVGGTYNAYTNADFRTDLSSGSPPAPAGCPSPSLDCKYIYVRDNVPQGLAAVMLAATEMEF